MSTQGLHGWWVVHVSWADVPSAVPDDQSKNMQVAHKDQLVVIADILWQLLGILCGFAEFSLQSPGALHWYRVKALRLSGRADARSLYRSAAHVDTHDCCLSRLIAGELEMIFTRRQVSIAMGGSRKVKSKKKVKGREGRTAKAGQPQPQVSRIGCCNPLHLHM